MLLIIVTVYDSYFEIVGILKDATAILTLFTFVLLVTLDVFV